MGYVSAALELAEQVRDGQLPEPARIVLPVGSTCTTAGLLVGLRLAQRANIAFTRRIPLVHAIRVTPWPITSPARIVDLARRTSRLLVELTGDAALGCRAASLREGLVVDGRFLCGGYGRSNAAGAQARDLLGEFGQTLDSTYSEKAAAGLLRVSREHEGPLLLWATKSSASLPEVPREVLAAAPARVKRWLRSCG
jgi:D-cysteine desulfhydrase